MFITALLVIALSMLIAPQMAWGETKHATPDGRSAGECTAADPCALRRAITTAGAGDRVRLAGGRYEMARQISTDRRVIVEAADAGDRPEIRITLDTEEVALRLGPASVLRDVDVSVEGLTRGLRVPGLIERVRVTIRARGAVGISARNQPTLVRDTVIRGSVDGAMALIVDGSEGAGLLRLRNVTAVLTGPETNALVAQSYPGRPAQVEARATLLRGAANTLLIGGEDGTPVSMDVTDSNLRPAAMRLRNPAAVHYVDGGGNSAAEPRFVDLAGGDLRPAAGSPTIDAGSVDDASGERDLAGMPRALGARADVGAFEYAPPPALKFSGQPVATAHTVATVVQAGSGVWGSVLLRVELLEADGTLRERTPARRVFGSSELRHTFEGLTLTPPTRCVRW